MSEIVSAPSPTGGIDWSAAKGSLIIAKPTEVERGIQTQYGQTDAVRADVFILTGPTEADEYIDCLIFPKVLFNQLRSQLGKTVVGRLGQGAAKGNQSAPWLLEEATPEDIEKARGFLDKTQPALATAKPPF